MDKTVIEEIAKQLGIAVDQAGQFITEQLPAFASMSVMKAYVSIIMNVGIFVFVLSIAIIAFITNGKQYRYHEEHRGEIWAEEGYWKKKERYAFASFYVFVVAAIILLIIFIPVFGRAIIDVQEIIGWSQYPESMLLNMALKAV